MADVRTVHTADLTGSVREAIRELLDAAFDGDFGDDDWEHTLGGVHVLVTEPDGIVGHVSVVARRLLHAEQAIRTGYVEGLAVRSDRRRRGLADLAMAEAERVITHAYDLGALSDGTGIPGFYVRRGWSVWSGPTYALGPDGPLRTADDDGGVLVLRTPTSPPLDLDGPISCDWRPGDVW